MKAAVKPEMRFSLAGLFVLATFAAVWPVSRPLVVVAFSVALTVVFATVAAGGDVVATGAVFARRLGVGRFRPAKSACVHWRRSRWAVLMRTLRPVIRFLASERPLDVDELEKRMVTISLPSFCQEHLRRA